MHRPTALLLTVVALLVTSVAAAGATPAETSDQRRLELVRVIGGAINPKSVVASGRGLVIAQNSIWNHTVTVYNRRGTLVHTIPDRIRLSRFGFHRYDEPVRGGPVEAAFSANGRFAYVTQRSMYGPGFNNPSPIDGVCSPSDDHDESFVYRIDMRRFKTTDVYKVGQLPKFLALTPDGKRLLVANWCSYDLSVIELSSGHEIRRVPLGPYPRGIAVTPDGRWAYVAVMGTDDLARVNLRTFRVRWIRNVGWNPRHLVIDPGGTRMYVTLDFHDEVAAIDLATRRVVQRRHTGEEPRSMAISSDGRSLYVGNYEDDTLTKLRASNLRILQTLNAPGDPIGITYDAGSRQVWVASYTGTLRLYKDR